MPRPLPPLNSKLPNSKAQLAQLKKDQSSFQNLAARKQELEQELQRIDAQIAKFHGGTRRSLPPRRFNPRRLR